MAKLISHWQIGTWKIKPLRTPWDNTLAYRPLKENLNDYSWNWHNFTWDATFSWNMATFYRIKNSWFSLAWYSWDFTIIAYSDSSQTNWMVYPWINSSAYPSIGLWCAWTWADFSFVNPNNTARISLSSTVNAWKHFVAWVKTSSKIYLYVDWVLVNQQTGTYWDMHYESILNNTRIWVNVNWSWNSTYWGVIIESKARDADEILSYYNQTKSDYWL